MPESLFSTSPTHVARTHSTSEDDWEDVPDRSEADRKPSSSPSPTGSLRVNSPRKRKTPQKATYSASPARRPPPLHQASKPTKVRRKVPATEEIVDGALDGAVFTINYVFDIFSTAIKLLRRPLYLITFLWLLAMIMSYISHTLRGAFAPLCYLPGLYGLRICRPIGREGKFPRWADYPKLVDAQSATFEHLLDESISGSGLSLEIKKAEMATADLVTLVRVSNLKSRDMLADSLSDFVEDAKKTGRDLQKLSSKIGGAVDNIMAVNDYALHSIEAAHSQRVPSIINMYGVMPWKSPSATNAIVTRTFGEAMNVLSTAMQRLILEAEVNLANLDKLEQRLATLHDIISREDSSLTSEKAEILSELWTKLGGNKKSLRNFENHLLMLKNVGMYRKKALAHVVAALQSLQSMSSDMEDIRERVAAPELTGSRIPVQVHMRSIKSGLERLREGRVRAKRLEEEAVRRVLGIDTGSNSTE